MKRSLDWKLRALALVAAALLAPAGAVADTGLPWGETVCPLVKDRVSAPVPEGAAPLRSGSRPALPRIPWPPVPEPEIIADPGQDLVLVRWRDVVADSVSAELPLLVSEGNVGLTVRATARSDEHLIFVELLGPGGVVLACSDCVDAPAVGEQRIGRGTTQMPSTDRPGWELAAGMHAIRVRASRRGGGGSPGAAVDVVAALRSESAVHVSHRIDLNFVYLPGIPLTSAVAETLPEFGELLDLCDDAMAPLGIRVGSVTHRDLNRPEFSMISSWEEAGEMFLTSEATGRHRAMNVYCVGGFDESLLNVAGLSGGIPGAPINGTRDSGIALRIMPTFPEFLPAYAVLFAHEVGHYLGLYHTTEANLLAEDPLSDTPRCHEPGLGACPDWDYEMFPIVNVGPIIWSESQIRICRTHPYVRSIPVVGAEPWGERAPAKERAGESRILAGANPFHHSVHLELGAQGPRASAAVFDVRGRRLRVLDAGSGRAVWNGHDDAGREVAPGVYFVRVVDGCGSPQTLRVVKLR